jgi:hypothetical protein
MSPRLALRCPSCQRVSYRSAGFVRAKAHFVCNFCHEIGKIDRHRLMLALARHEAIVELEADALEPAMDGTDGTGRHR